MNNKDMLIAAQRAYIKFLGGKIDSWAAYLHAHGQSASTEEIEKGVLHRSNIKYLEDCIAEDVAFDAEIAVNAERMRLSQAAELAHIRLRCGTPTIMLTQEELEGLEYWKKMNPDKWKKVQAEGFESFDEYPASTEDNESKSADWRRENL